MSSPFEPPSKIDVESEARKTIDSSWDSPFHSLGKGTTQAAPGNHGHPENLTQDEILAGNNITINKNTDGTITIHGADAGAPISDHGALSNRLIADQHNVASITGLQGALDGKSPVGHGHSEYATAGHGHSGLYVPTGTIQERRTLTNTYMIPSAGVIHNVPQLSFIITGPFTGMISSMLGYDAGVSNPPEANLYNYLEFTGSVYDITRSVMRSLDRYESPSSVQMGLRVGAGGSVTVRSKCYVSNLSAAWRLRGDDSWCRLDAVGVRAV